MKVLLDINTSKLQRFSLQIPNLIDQISRTSTGNIASESHIAREHETDATRSMGICEI